MSVLTKNSVFLKMTPYNLVNSYHIFFINSFVPMFSDIRLSSKYEVGTKQQCDKTRMSATFVFTARRTINKVSVITIEECDCHLINKAQEDILKQPVEEAILNNKLPRPNLKD